MRSKAPLALMEQMVMILVFAVASALCLQAFAQSELISRRGEDRDRAAVLCQSVAEVVRSNGGDLSAALRQVTGQRPGARDAQGVDLVDYREDWTIIDHWNAQGGDTVYRLIAEAVDSGYPGLGQARVSVTQAGETEPLFQLDVAWQVPLDAAIPQEDKDRALKEAQRLAAEIRERGLGASALWGESDGMGGWHQYFNGGWEPEISYAQAVYELWYSGGKVEAAWNQTDENGFVTGVRVILCTVNLGEEEGHA